MLKTTTISNECDLRAAYEFPIYIWNNLVRTFKSNNLL